MLSSLTSFVQSFVQPIGIAPVGILAVLSILVIVGLVAGIYRKRSYGKLHKSGVDRLVRLATAPMKSR